MKEINLESSFECPHCHTMTSKTYKSYEASYCYFSGLPNQGINALNTGQLSMQLSGTKNLPTDTFLLEIFKCSNPVCRKVSSTVTGCGSDFEDRVILINPNSNAKHFPEYVPKAIREDYEEAFSILHISPKASATLSRRALQGMIRNYFRISEKNLYLEIEAIKDLVTPIVWQTLNSIRQLGNIGAHMEKDVNLIVDIDDNESEKLLMLIEYLIKSWYLDRHEAEELMNEINDINSDKQAQRKLNK